jgi:predicted short-subunit dehydrogenase-like oxidoreductase (DUF2520 family)
VRKRTRGPALRGQTIALVGAGGLARALAPALRGAGARVVIAVRAAFAADAAAAVGDASSVILCVPDDALAGVARELARCGPGRGRSVLHASGFAGLRPLAPLARAGWKTGWLHPLLPMPRGGGRARRFEGAWFALGGCARPLVRALGGRELALRRGSEADYHLAATLVSNGSLALFELARRHFERATQNRTHARTAFAALLAATAANLAQSNPREALTGPIARGDLESVRGHLARSARGDERALYRALGRVLLELAAPRLAPARQRELRTLLR